MDSRKRPIRGLWIRNGRYYAQLKLEDPATGKKAVRRIPLKVSGGGEAITTLSEALSALARLQVQRVDNALPVLRRTPKFSEYADQYLASIAGAKASATHAKERSTLKLWKAHLGDLRLDQIKKAHVREFGRSRLATGVSTRTVNLDLISLRNVLNRALDDEHIAILPTRNIRALEVKTKKRGLVSSADIERVCQVAFAATKQQGQEAQARGRPVTRNAQQFADYVRLMAFSGARRDEALRLKWADVGFEREQITIGAEGLAKNHQARIVDFNANLKTLLVEMHSRRAPDSQWVFPSPQRGAKDIPASTFKESLNAARLEAGLPAFNFHDCRHFFISYCVMSGIDYMTIAKWVGHQDGGVLIGKVYGHLTNEHARKQANKLRFDAAAGA